MDMESEDDIQPLISYENVGSRDTFLELTVQNINTDPEFEQVKFSNLCTDLLIYNYTGNNLV